MNHGLALTLHLAVRTFRVQTGDSMLGAAWPLVRQLAQLAVLVVVFSKVLPLGIPNYAIFVFCGLLGWSWFVTGLQAASTSVRDNRNLAMRPRFPTITLPLVATMVPFIDIVIALPVLLAALVFTGELHASAPLLLPLLAVQGILAVGLGWMCGAATVFFRDVPHAVGLVLTLGFYLTPVYFDVSRVPADYQWIVRLNPMAILLEADRAVLIGTPGPPLGALLATFVFTGVAAIGGWLVFTRSSPAFADEL